MATIDESNAVWRALSSRSYTRKVVRDLIWSVTSPHLIDAQLFPVLPVTFGVHGSDANAATLVEWLSGLERDASHLIAFLKGKTKSKTKALALGVYFASLLEYWLRFSPLLRIAKFELSKQIISASNQTLGQLKFLFRVMRGLENDDEFDDYHVESSVKFFLLHPLDDQHGVSATAQVTYPLEQFVGPHLGENLAWRVQEVARKLDMCRGASVQTWLRDHYSDRVASHIVLRGFLFYPLRHFQSTSEVSRGHDWAFHRNPGYDCSGTAAAPPPPRHNPKVGADHLRGWWTSDLENEFPEKVHANDATRIGESRFAVLPKLHWLSPVLAEEDPESNQVTVHGDDELQIEPVATMTLQELITFSRAHFATLAVAMAEADGAASAKTGVVMPLLVAEIVRCHPQDLEFGGNDDASCSRTRWRELSRGFIMDPSEKSWDPLPLCHDAVRFKRSTTTTTTTTTITNGNDPQVANNEREYEGRREWINDGVIKPSDHEAELARLKKLHAFTELETMTPAKMCDELLGIMKRDQKKFTHGNLKQSVQSVLNQQQQHHEIQFILASLQYLVFECHPTNDDEQDDEQDDGNGGASLSSKGVQRVAHLLFDAVEDRSKTATTSASISDDLLVDFTKMFVQIAHDEARWDYINLSLRGVDILQKRLQHSATASLDDSNNSVFAVITQRLLASKTPRWNAVAVEVVRVLYGSSSSTTKSTTITTTTAGTLRREMLDELMDQHDWKNAEQLVTMCCHNHTELLVVLFKRFNALNMAKPMKRLRKLLLRVHGNGQGGFEETIGNGVDKSAVFQHALGPLLDADANRAKIADQIPAFRWTLADTPAHIDEILAKLGACVGKTQPTIVGLDCEWRPQFLTKQDAAAAAHASTDDDGDGDGGTELPVGEDEGVSVYQIAVGDHVYVVDVQVLGLIAEAPLRFIWEAPRGSFVLVGFCVSGDLRRLNHSFPSLLTHSGTPQPRLLVELKQMALYRQLPAGPWGLSQLYEACFNEQVAKEEQCSDWGLRPLTESQLAYAARDAYVVRNVALLLLADVSLPSTGTQDLTQYVERFAVVTDLGMLGSGIRSEAALGNWITTLVPLNESHVRAALIQVGLVATAESLFRIDKTAWQGQARTEMGLVVKTIAIVLRRGSTKRFTNGGPHDSNLLHYVAVVLHVDESIDMAALAVHLDVAEQDLVLADKETLLRVFGYTRGSIGPIGLREQAAIHVIVDAALLDERVILPGAGHEDAMYAIDPRVLCETVGASVAVLTSGDTNKSPV